MERWKQACFGIVRETTTHDKTTTRNMQHAACIAANNVPKTLQIAESYASYGLKAIPGILNFADLMKYWLMDKTIHGNDAVLIVRS